MEDKLKLKISWVWTFKSYPSIYIKMSSSTLEIIIERYNKELFYIALESLSSGYVRRFKFWRSWVQIPAPFTGWTFSHYFVVKLNWSLFEKTENKLGLIVLWPQTTKKVQNSQILKERCQFCRNNSKHSMLFRASLFIALGSWSITQIL